MVKYNGIIMEYYVVMTYKIGGNMAVLVTGGLGYIGSHTVVELIKNNYDVVIIDNLSNSQIDVLEKLETITNKKIKLYIDDVRDKYALMKIFHQNNIECVIHFAGLKAVGESTEMPLYYYDNNIGSTLSLLEVMKEFNCKNLIFSSSATVYGEPERIPLDEECRLDATNPYGRTKLFIEHILEDVYKSDKNWNIVLLRYFNPIGAHKSGLIGEKPNGVPNNLLPYVAQVATGEREFVRVWGNDYPTIDGTGVRDYIHVCDLANGHVCAIKDIKENAGLTVYNLGTGNGYSVLQVISAFEKACGKTIPYKFFDRRPGDIAVCYANTNKAREQIGFVAKYNIEEMVKDHWNFQKKLVNYGEESGNK